MKRRKPDPLPTFDTWGDIEAIRAMLPAFPAAYLAKLREVLEGRLAAFNGRAPLQERPATVLKLVNAS